MSSPKSIITRKAAKAVVAHSAHGTVSKARRQPVRTATLLGLGAMLGTVIGFLLGRRQGSTVAPSPFAHAPATPFPAPTPPPVVSTPA
jgi:hypothetical protein